jgi:type I restriction enzyme M protein
VRKKEILFIDATEFGYMKDRVHRDFSEEDIQKISKTYHQWRKSENYEDVLGYSKSANLEEIAKNDFVLTPGRYVGIPEEEDDGIPFEDKMKDLTEKLSEQMEKEQELNGEIKNQLEKIEF